MRSANSLNWTIEHKDIFETQYILDLNGEILALDDNSREKGLKPGDSVPMDEKALAMLLEMKHSTYTELYEFKGMERLSGYAPIFENHDPTGKIIAISVIDFDGSIVGERTWDVVRNGILISLIPMILASLITLFLIRRRTKPISELIAHAKEIADGNLAIEDTIVKGNDEIADLGRTLNIMTANLRNMIGTVQTTAIQLTKNSLETAASLSEMQEWQPNKLRKIWRKQPHQSLMGQRMQNMLHRSCRLLPMHLQDSKVKAERSVENSHRTMRIC